jgi:hypothetical protein
MNGTLGATTPSTVAATSISASTTLGVTGVSTLTGGAVIEGMTVGKGAGAVATNTAVGASALAANTSGANNTAAGYQAGYSNTTGAYQLFLGYQSGYGVTTGTNNTFVGHLSGESMTTGNKNVILGRYSGNAGGLDIRTASNNIVLSDGDGNPRGIFNSSGIFLIGCTSVPGGTTNGISLINPSASQTDAPRFSAGATTTSVYQMTFVNGNGFVGSITTSGSSTLFNVTSDQRLKENIQDAESASSLIDSLQVRQFDWKSDNSHQRYGFIAQELVSVAPEAVHQPTDTEQMMAVDYSKLVPMLVKEIQSLRKRLAALESA